MRKLLARKCELADDDGMCNHGFCPYTFDNTVFCTEIVDRSAEIDDTRAGVTEEDVED